MNFQELLDLCFGKEPPKRAIPKGLPRNIFSSGRVMKRPPTVIKYAHRQHTTREGEACFHLEKVVTKSRTSYRKRPTLLHRGVAHSIFKAQMNAEKRRKAKRYVW